MTDRDDTIRDIAVLVHNALHRYPSPSVRAGRVAKRIGLGEDDSAEAIEAGLREALGVPGADRPQGLAGRVTAVLAAEGYTDSREVFPGAFLVTGAGDSVTVCVPWVGGDDADRARQLKRLARALREGGLHVREWERCYLQVSAQPGEGSP